MKEQEIIQNNKLMAEFLEWEKLEHGYNDWKKRKDHELRYETPFNWTEPNVVSFISQRNDYDISEMSFNKSWEWLMPVVEKIENAPNYDYFVHILGNGCFITTNNPENYKDGDNSIVESIIIEKSKLQATYEAVIEFIKWYNENK